jgi:hypothetical protein
MSIYDQDKAAWDRMAASGRPNLAEMAKRFGTAAEMDAALGLNGAVRHWAKGESLASTGTETAAKLWLEKHDKPKPELPSNGTTQGRVLMVVCNDATADRAIKMLAILGCEVVEV